jgi:hypothetical protein
MTNGPLPSPPELGPSSRILSSSDGRTHYVLGLLLLFLFLFFFWVLYTEHPKRANLAALMLTTHFISRQVSSRALSATAR